MMASPARVCVGPDAPSLSTMPIAEEEEPVIINAETGEQLSFGDVVADRITREIGSWRFISIYFVLLLSSS